MLDCTGRRMCTDEPDGQDSAVETRKPAAYNGKSNAGVAHTEFVKVLQAQIDSLSTQVNMLENKFVQVSGRLDDYQGNLNGASQTSPRHIEVSELDKHVQTSHKELQECSHRFLELSGQRIQDFERMQYQMEEQHARRMEEFAEQLAEGMGKFAEDWALTADQFVSQSHFKAFEESSTHRLSLMEEASARKEGNLQSVGILEFQTLQEDVVKIREEFSREIADNNNKQHMKIEGIASQKSDLEREVEGIISQEPDSERSRQHVKIGGTYGDPSPHAINTKPRNGVSAAASEALPTSTVAASTLAPNDAEQLVLQSLGTFKESIWESALLMGLPQLGNCVSIVLLLVLNSNICMQVLFVLIIYRRFPHESFDASTISEWRRLVGHDVSQVDTFGRSMISQVCAMHPSVSVAYAQMQTLEVAHQYLGDGAYDGPIMCVLVIVIWYLVMSTEAERTIQLMKAMSLVPRHSYTRVCVADDGRWFLDTLHIGRKIFMCCICITRIATGILLFWRGTLWLVYTVSITELVLNAVALGFIFDIDELLYKMFVPKCAKAMLLNLDINAYKSSTTNILGYGFEVSFVLRVTFLYVFLIIIYLTAVHPNIETVENIIEYACGGEKDFVAGEHQELGLTFYSRSTGWSSSLQMAKSGGEDPVDQIIHGRNVIAASQLPDIATMRSFLAKTPSELADDLMPSCTDSSPSDYPSYWERMKELVKLPSAVSCKDKELSKMCGDPSMHLVRMLCPETCRCYYARPSTAIAEGCPYLLCQDNRATAGYYDSSVNCTDDATAALAADPGWRGYWESLAKEETFQRTVNFPKEAVDIAVQSGCSAITEYDLHAEVCAEFSNRHSLGTYCPETCECRYHDYWGCPSHCFLIDDE